MSLFTIAILGIALLLISLLLLKIPVGFALAMVGFLGFAYVINFKAAFAMLGTEVWSTFSSYGLTTIPLFILMGQVCFYAGLNKRLYNTAYVLMGGLRGGLAIATILACAGFSMISGSNTATAATMSAVALPEMRKYKYSDVLAASSVAVGGTLGALIPPSVVMMIIALQTGQSMGKIFSGGILIGLLLTLLLCLTVAVVCRIHPKWGPGGPKTTVKEKILALPGALDMIIIFALVMAGLFTGFFTPSEAGAAGAAAALLVSLATRRLTWQGFIKAVADTIRVSAMIFMLVLGGVIFGRFLAVTRLPYDMAQWAGDQAMPAVLILVIICLIYAIGGMLLDALALLIMTIPIFFPLADKLGYDPLWFAILVTLVTTMGAVTPPVAINAFVVAGMCPGLALEKLFKGIMYFIVAYLICIGLLIAFPGLATFIPSLVK